ncbi:MAG: peptide ABC transporter substrate-binding protein, partial [Cyanobacteria bacterium J083]
MDNWKKYQTGGRKNLAIILLTSFLLTSCGQNSNSFNGRDPNVLKLLYWQAPTILNPHLSTGSKDLEASRITLEPLATFNNEGEMLPVLAAEIPSQDNGGVSKDGKSVIWRLKRGIKWSDGENFTAADVVFTYKFLNNPATAAVTKGTYDIVAQVEALDNYTVKIQFKDVTPAWFQPFVGVEGMILPQHIYREYNGAKSRQAPANLKPIGTGAYRVVEFKPGDTVIYEPNPHFRQADQLSFTRVELKGGGDATSAARAVLQTNEADFAYNLQVENSILQQLATGGKGKVVANIGAAMERILFNFTDPSPNLPEKVRSTVAFPHPFFSDLKVRQAFALAIDRDTIATQLYGATGKATANVLVAPPKYVSSNTSYEFNLTKAKQLLDGAGWQDSNGDGIRDKNSKEMSVVFQTSVNPLRQKTQEIIKQALSSIGVKVELRSIDASVFFSSDPSSKDTLERFYADLEMFTREINNPDPAAYMRTYICAEIPSPANNWSGNNATRYCNPEYDALWRQSTKEL